MDTAQTTTPSIYYTIFLLLLIIAAIYIILYAIKLLTAKFYHLTNQDKTLQITNTIELDEQRKVIIVSYHSNSYILLLSQAGDILLDKINN